MIVEMNQIAKPQRGLTLIELLISLVIAAIVLSGVTAVFITTLQSTRDLISATRLEQDLNAPLLVMSEDIRRAGYWGPDAETATDLTLNPFQQSGSSRLQLGEFSGEASDSCITYAYNFDRDSGVSVAEPSEYFGFRLRDSVLEMFLRDSSSSSDCTASSSTEWREMIDSDLIDIERLEFQLPTPTVVASSAGVSLSRWVVEIELEARLAADHSVRKQASTTVLIGNLVAD